MIGDRFNLGTGLSMSEYARAIEWRNRYAERGVYRERLTGGQYSEARELPLIEHGFSRRDIA